MERDNHLIGKKLTNYRIERLIKRGGMASVYYGWDIQLERPVAIKVIDARYRDKPGYAERFLREARAIATWHHENILQIYYADNEEGLYYYVMEYICGLDLSQLIAQYNSENELTPLIDVIRIGWACARALDYAHQKGVIHRDVKPSNLLLSEEGRVVLGDFGIAMDISQGTYGKVFGSPQYIAPEQARNSANAVPQSDLYSLGVILFEMLTGRPPFEDPSPTSLAIQHLTIDPPKPRSLNPALSIQVEDVLLKALEKSPDKRFQSGGELIGALEEALEDQLSFTASPIDSAPEIVGNSRQDAFKTVSKTSLAERVADYIQANPPLPADNTPVLEKGGTTYSKTYSVMARWGAGCGVLLLIAILFVILVSSLTPNRQSPGAAFSPPTTSPATITTVPTLQQTVTASDAQSSPTLVEQTQTLQPKNSPTTQPTAATPPTATQASTRTATEAPDPAPTGTNVPAESTRIGSNLFVMYYDDTSFYIKNLSGKDRSIYPFTFERINDNGDLTDRFEGWHWGNIYSRFRSDYCLVLEILNYTEHLEPEECNNRHLVMHYPPLNRDYLFWIEDNDSQEFRVLWEDQEVGRCKIKDGTCEVYLP